MECESLQRKGNSNIINTHKKQVTFDMRSWQKFHRGVRNYFNNGKGVCVVEVKREERAFEGMRARYQYMTRKFSGRNKEKPGRCGRPAVMA